MNRIRYFLLAAVLAIAAFVLLPTAVFAADSIDGGNTVASIRLSALAVSAIISLVIPVIVGLLTKTTARIKGLVSVVLNAIQTLIVGATLADGTAVFGEQTLITWLLSTAISVTTYLNIWKPLGVTSSVVEVNGVEVDGKLSNVGVK